MAVAIPDDDFAGYELLESERGPDYLVVSAPALEDQETRDKAAWLTLGAILATVRTYEPLSRHDAVLENARRLSADNPGIPFCVLEVRGYTEHDTNAFVETAEREVRRFVSGAEVEVPDDSWMEV